MGANRRPAGIVTSGISDHGGCHERLDSDMQKLLGLVRSMDGYECCTGSAVESKSIVHAVVYSYNLRQSSHVL